MERTILHCDMNSCYASIECFHNPAIRNKSVAVAGKVEMRHGIILAKNNIAKKYDIKTGETLAEARAKCPDIVIVPPNYPLYLSYSDRIVNEIYSIYTDRIERFGIDEAWLDVTASVKLLGMDGRQIADEIRERVKRQLGITVSVGVSWNKVFAKLGSDVLKPDGTTVFTREDYKETVWNMPAHDMLGVGRATRNTLSKHCIYTIGDIARKPVDRLKSWLGKWGEYLHIYANGLDNSPVHHKGHEAVIKSVGNSTTTPRDITCLDDVSITYTVLCENIAARLRLHSLLATTVSISIRDTNLMWFTRQRKLKHPTCIATELRSAALELFKDNYNFYNKAPLRSIGVSGTGTISSSTYVQLDLFNDAAGRAKEEKLERAIDDIKRRFGYDAIKRCNQYKDFELGSLDPNIFPVMPPGTTTCM